MNLALIPHGYSYRIATPKKQIVVSIPFGVQGGFAYLRRVHLTGAIHLNLGKGVG